jgi:hypothetical protein
MSTIKLIIKYILVVNLFWDINVNIIRYKFDLFDSHKFRRCILGHIIIYHHPIQTYSILRAGLVLTTRACIWCTHVPVFFFDCQRGSCTCYTCTWVRRVARTDCLWGCCRLGGGNHVGQAPRMHAQLLDACAAVGRCTTPTGTQRPEESGQSNGN